MDHSFNSLYFVIQQNTLFTSTCYFFKIVFISFFPLRKMNLKEDYEEVCIKIIESIEETFSKLCPLWDKIGLVPSSSRDSTKINLMNSCVEAVDQHLEYIYETELRVFCNNHVLFRNNLNMKKELLIQRIRFKRFVRNWAQGM